MDACPSRDQLQQFLNAALPPEASEEIARHVDHCDCCCRTLEELVAAPKLDALVREHYGEQTEATKIEFPNGRIGSLRIRDCLGRGGVGMVYKAWDEQLQRTVAVKVLKPQWARNPKHCERFLREARA